MERIDLPPVADDWVVQAFIQGLNPQNFLASQQLKQILIEYPAVTWVDVYNRYQSKIRVELHVVYRILRYLKGYLGKGMIWGYDR